LFARNRVQVGDGKGAIKMVAQAGSCLVVDT
jgi:hypothetical protein